MRDRDNKAKRETNYQPSHKVCRICRTHWLIKSENETQKIINHNIFNNIVGIGEASGMSGI